MNHSCWSSMWVTQVDAQSKHLLSVETDWKQAAGPACTSPAATTWPSSDWAWKDSPHHRLCPHGRTLRFWCRGCHCLPDWDSFQNSVICLGVRESTLHEHCLCLFLVGWPAETCDRVSGLSVVLYYSLHFGSVCSLLFTLIMTFFEYQKFLHWSSIY